MPVSLASGPGNCFSLKYPFPDPVGTTGWEYQNGDGHCLWDNNGIIDVGGACKAGHPNEEFYGAELDKGQGWIVSDEAEAGYCMNGDGSLVVMSYVGGGGSCYLWNFPSG
ncbi:MAG TPA: hypothetical protein VHZ03_44215 [Trebonia sp.]|nr:hypothetical protein [Trebonia sp.]